MRRSCRSCSCRPCQGDHAALAHPLAKTKAQAVQPRAAPALSLSCGRARDRGDHRHDGAMALTPAEAQRLQDEARAAGRWITWFVAAAEGRAVAWAMMADPHGGKRLPGERRCPAAPTSPGTGR